MLDASRMFLKLIIDLATRRFEIYFKLAKTVLLNVCFDQTKSMPRPYPSSVQFELFIIFPRMTNYSARL